MQELVFHICFSSDYFQGKTQAYKEDLITKACLCTKTDLISSDVRKLARPIVDRAIASFGTKRITKLCIEIIEYTTNGFISTDQTYRRALELIGSLYTSPALHKSFFEQKIHVTLLQGYWTVQEYDPEAMFHCAPMLMLHLMRSGPSLVSLDVTHD